MLLLTFRSTEVQSEFPSQEPFIAAFSLTPHECSPLLANIQYLSFKTLSRPFYGPVQHYADALDEEIA